MSSITKRSLDQASEKKYAQSSNVDDGVLDNLSNIISALSNEGDSKNFRPLIVFFQKGFLSQVVQVWSYYAQVNNHPKFSKTTNLLANVLRQLNADENCREYGTSMIDSILNGHIKVLYRGVNNIRASITNPILRLMKEIVSFHSGHHVEAFVANFDFSLPSLIRILSVNKADVPAPNQGSNNGARSTIRSTFLDFWLELITQCSPLARKQIILANFKIMGAWFKLMDKMDSPELMSRTLDVFTNLILREPSYKRMTKCKILNELALSKIHAFYNSPDRSVIKKVNEFFLAYGSDHDSSVAFPDDALWFSNSPVTGTHRGVEISINQRRFKVYNKLLFNMLRIFKPWEDDMQLNTVVKILENVPELVAPYTAFLASLGAHDPKMTSYWFGCTMLLGRIIHLKIPALMERVETDTAPHTSLVMESILPSSLTRSALTKSLQHEKLIIRQLACQLIIFAFQKLEVVLDLYDRKGWYSSKASFRNSFHLSLPDLFIVSAVMKQSYELYKENRILQLSLSTILKYYSAIFPNFFNLKLPSSNVFLDIMQSNTFSGMDLAILESFLSFQELNGLQTKWWIKSSQEQSFFTALLNVSRDSSNSLTERICQLLDDMFHGSAVFSRNLECSPHRALVRSLQSIPREPKTDMTQIWKILDESIQHVMRVPYKYVDLSAEHDRISPYIIALLEQCKYSIEDHDSTFCQMWVSFYLRTMILCGESEEGIESAAKIYLPDACQLYIKNYLGENPILQDSTDEMQTLDNLMTSSFSDLVVLQKYSELNNITRSPISELDAASLVFRVRALVKDVSVKYDGYFKSTTEHLITMLASYAAADQSFTFLSRKVLGLLLQIISEPSVSEFLKLKSKYVIRLMLQIRQEFRPSCLKLSPMIFEWLENNDQILQETVADDDDTQFLSVLFNSVALADCTKLLDHTNELSITSTLLLLGAMLEHHETCIRYSTIVQLLQNSSPDSLRVASQFIAQNRVLDLQTGDLLSITLSDDAYSIVNKAFTTSAYFTIDDVLPHLRGLKGQTNALLIALALKDFKQKEVQEFVQGILMASFSSLKSYDLPTSKLALELLSECPGLLSNEKKNQLIEFLSEEYKEKYSAIAVKCFVMMGNFEDKTLLKWLNKMVLYITKYFSAATTIDSHLTGALSELQKLKGIIWEKVNKNILSSHLEAILSGGLVNQAVVMEYALHVLLAVDAEHTWNERLMQCLLNNQSKKLLNREGGDYLNFLTAAALYVLYLGDSARNSNAVVQEALLNNYEGSMASKDRLILKILELIEGQISLSWTNLIYAWELVDDTEDDVSFNQTTLITKRKEGLIITLRRQTIARSASNYIFDRPGIPSVERSMANKTWSSLLSFYHSTEKNQSFALSSVYDPSFLLLLSVQNEELVRTSRSEDGGVEYVFDVKAFISSNIFQVLICALGDNSDIQSIALALVEAMLSGLQRENSPRELRIFRILLSKIVYTFMESKAAGREQNNRIAPCLWFAISQLTVELAQPTSQLHEKAIRWVLSRPLIRSNDLPLYHDLLRPQEKSGTEQNLHYKQLGWVLNVLQQGLKTEHDVELIKRIGILEWLSNLLNLPYINGKMRSAVSGIFYACQRLGNSGSTLITRSASIATFEMQKISLERKLEFAELEVMNNSKNSRHLQKLLSLEQQTLNSIEVLSGNEILARSSKRLREWTGDDATNIGKRVKNSSALKISGH